MAAPFELAEPITSFPEIGDLLVNLADALQVLVAGYGPPWADGAPVLTDLHLDQQMEGTPLLDGVLMGNVYLEHAEDHLLAAAKIVDDPRVLMGCYTLARPVLGSASRAMWLLEPGISPVERMRRAMNLQLKRFAELENIASDRDPTLRKQLAAALAV